MENTQGQSPLFEQIQENVEKTRKFRNKPIGSIVAGLLALCTAHAIFTCQDQTVKEELMVGAGSLLTVAGLAEYQRKGHNLNLKNEAVFNTIKDQMSPKDVEDYTKAVNRQTSKEVWTILINFGILGAYFASSLSYSLGAGMLAGSYVVGSSHKPFKTNRDLLNQNVRRLTGKSLTY